MVRVLNLLSAWIHSTFGSTQFEKFVIISRSRSGSTFLMSLMAQHPQILIAGERFRESINQDVHRKWNDLFSRKLWYIKAVGFKLFYYHPIGSDDKTIWRLIEKDKNIKVIHLRRENILRTVVSREIASMTGQWKKSSHLPLEEKQIILSKEFLSEQFNKTRLWENETREKFQNKPFIEITYEELTQDQTETLNRVSDFLELEKFELKSKMAKQNSEELDDLVLNYNDLRHEFKGTHWENMFQ